MKQARSNEGKIELVIDDGYKGLFEIITLDLTKKELTKMMPNDLDIDPRRNTVSGMDAKKAVQIVIEKLTTHEGFYTWTALGEPAVWLLRVPKENKNEEWEKNEASDMIHLCRPVKFVEAMARNDRKDLSMFAGYIIDSKCVRCKAEIPEDVEKRLSVQIKLSKLRKKAL